MAVFTALIAAGGPAFCQLAPPAASSLEDVSGCSVDGDHVFISTGKDAAARRFKYPWDATIDALCNARGYAIGAPSKKAAPSPTPRVAPAAPGVDTAPAAPLAAAGAPGFPTDAVALSADAVAKRIAGQTFGTQLRDGTRVRLEYKTSGYLFANAPGYANSGPWRVEESRICSHMRNSTPSCNEVRELGPTLYLKRDNGDVIALNPQ